MKHKLFLLTYYLVLLYSDYNIIIIIIFFFQIKEKRFSMGSSLIESIPSLKLSKYTFVYSYNTLWKSLCFQVYKVVDLSLHIYLVTITFNNHTLSI